MAIFQQTYKVYINHTDAGGIVYHANHLTFFENCRRDWLSSLGFDGYFFDLQDFDDNNQQNLTDSDIIINKNSHGQNGATHFVVSKANLSYLSALFVDDLLTVSIDKVQIKSASIVLHQSIRREHQQQAATTGIITLACVKNDGKQLKISRLPISFINKIQSLAKL